MRFMNGKKVLGAVYFSIDGHVWGFAPKLIVMSDLIVKFTRFFLIIDCFAPLGYVIK